MHDLLGQPFGFSSSDFQIIIQKIILKKVITVILAIMIIMKVLI